MSANWRKVRQEGVGNAIYSGEVPIAAYVRDEAALSLFYAAPRMLKFLREMKKAYERGDDVLLTYGKLKSLNMIINSAVGEYRDPYEIPEQARYLDPERSVWIERMFREVLASTGEDHHAKKMFFKRQLNNEGFKKPMDRFHFKIGEQYRNLRDAFTITIIGLTANGGARFISEPSFASKVHMHVGKISVTGSIVGKTKNKEKEVITYYRDHWKSIRAAVYEVEYLNFDLEEPKVRLMNSREAVVEFCERVEAEGGWTWILDPFRNSVKLDSLRR